MITQHQLLADLDAMDIGLTIEEKVELVAVMFAEEKPTVTRTRKIAPGAQYRQPVWALMDRPFGIGRGFRTLHASEADESFDYDEWAQNAGVAFT